MPAREVSQFQFGTKVENRSLSIRVTTLHQLIGGRFYNNQIHVRFILRLALQYPIWTFRIRPMPQYVHTLGLQFAGIYLGIIVTLFMRLDD
jgi:hypothetical protein